MENFNQIFTLIANYDGISLNSDILETGLLNIIALLAILISTGRDFLGSVLEERKTTIINGVQDAENRLNDSQKRLTEAQKQLSQANLIISDIRNETLLTKKSLLKGEAIQTKKDLKLRFEKALTAFQSKERQIFVEIKQQIISLILKQTIIRTQETFQSKERTNILINKTIDQLEGELL